MQSKCLVQQICELNRRGIYIGLQVGEMGIHVWMTDRHFRSRVDYVIKEHSAQAVDVALSTWLASEATNVAKPCADVSLALSRDEGGERWPLHDPPLPTISPSPGRPGKMD
jgi:hypothetical protein